MNTYYLIHEKTEREVVIQALSFSVEKHLYVFYIDAGGKIINKMYNTYNWDLNGVEYDTTSR